MANRDNSSHSLANRKREAIAAAKAAGVAPPSWAVQPPGPATAPPAAPAPPAAAPAPNAAASPTPSAPPVPASVPKTAPAPAPTPPAADPTPPVALSKSEIVESDDGLSPAQRSAITQLARGRSIKAAADAVGIHRGTLHRWLREDPAFRAAFHAWQAEALDSLGTQLLSLGAPSVRTYRRAINKGDVRAAGQVLKGLGLFTPPRPGPQDPAECRRVAELEQTQRDSALTEQENAAFDRNHHAHSRLPYGIPNRFQRRSKEAIKKLHEDPNYFGPEPDPEKGTDKTRPD